MRVVPLAVAVALASSPLYASNDIPKPAAITRLECGAVQKSVVSNTSLHLVFANHTRGNVAIYWLDFNGDRVWYNTLSPGTSYEQQTYVTHPWVVVDSAGHCLQELVPNVAGTFDVPIR